MKPNRKAQTLQRKILTKKTTQWMKIREFSRPPSGWLRAVRSALGITTRQLANFVGTNHAGVLAMEKREASGRITIETLEKAAKAMGCRLVYAVVPDEPNRSLDEILERRASEVAKRIVSRIEHSMRLEGQGSPQNEIEREIRSLALELKSSFDSRLWDAPGRRKT